MSETFWASDFIFSGRRVHVRKTGANLVLDTGLLTDVGLWLSYYLPVRLRGAGLRLVRPGPRIWFSPDQPRPWYLIWLAATWAGARFVTSADQADLKFFLEDATVCAAPPSGDGVNFACTDVSKSHVAEIFETVFGYPLKLDPQTWTGPAVEKGEVNGAHDGRVVTCPCPAAPDKVYQHLVDNRHGDQVQDLRTPCVGGKPVLVFIKSRPVDDRFANYNSTVSLTEVQAVFSPPEIELIERFTQAMQMEWGGLDILRDRVSNRLYIVDVNKTDMPPLRLPWRQKMKAIRLLSEALLGLVQGRKTESPA